VGLVQIDVIGSEALQAEVDFGHNCFARKAAPVRIFAHGIEELGREHDLVAVCEIAEGTANHLFTCAVGIHIGSVEEVDARFERALNEWPALFFVQNPRAPLT
jgi:hypothetical protein